MNLNELEQQLQRDEEEFERMEQREVLFFMKVYAAVIAVLALFGSYLRY